MTAGHDVMTVREQNLQGARDETVFRVCAEEERILVTLDHDFGQVLRFPPERSAGPVILETAPRITSQSLLNRLRDFLTLAESHSPAGTLWIVGPEGFEFIWRKIDEDHTAVRARTSDVCEEDASAPRTTSLARAAVAFAGRPRR